MIHGAHVIVYSTNADADRDFFRNVLAFPHVDAGHGWLIFALPPAEVAVHPGDLNEMHELYLMCDDVHALRAEMSAKNVESTPVSEERWGSLSYVSLPGGGKIGVYQPKHPSPIAKAAPAAARTRAPAKKAAPRKASPKKKAAAKRAPAKKAPAKKAKRRAR